METHDTTVLIVDDEQGPRFGMRRFLKAKGFDVLEAEDCASAWNRFHEEHPDLCIIDYRLPDGTALELLPRFASEAPDVPIIVLTGHGSIDLAVEAMKLGAEQFLTKPVDMDTLLLIIERSLEGARNKRHVSADQKSRGRASVTPFLGPSRAIAQLAESAARVARSDSPVLIQGETGTGKTLLARWLHEHSRRGGEPFVDLNCGGLSREFLESELFGHEKGAFTGAVSAKPGLLEIAHRGTIFLDEIGDMDAQVQPKVLKVLEEKRFRRMGAVRDMSVDVRLVAATHLDLEQLSQEGRFRADLYYRVSALPLSVPPLRERLDDIPVLARHFLEILSRDLRIPLPDMTADAEQALKRHFWSGNIRELRNVLERALIHGKGPRIDAPDLGLGNSHTAKAEPSNRTLDENEKAYIEQVLTEEQGHVDSAADRLGLTRSTLYYKIRKHGVVIPKGR